MLQWAPVDSEDEIRVNTSICYTFNHTQQSWMFLDVPALLKSYQYTNITALEFICESSEEKNEIIITEWELSAVKLNNTLYLHLYTAYKKGWLDFYTELINITEHDSYFNLC